MFLFTLRITMGAQLYQVAVIPLVCHHLQYNNNVLQITQGVFGNFIQIERVINWLGVRLLLVSHHSRLRHVQRG